MRFIDLFSGIGGFRLALESLGLDCVFSCEIDKFARQTYKANFGEEPSGDITKISNDEIPDHDILTAGFPCQAFSIAGKRRGFDDTRGTLFFEVARIIKDKQPKAFILENVPGLVSHEKGAIFQTIIDTLAITINGQKSFIETDNLGYHVYYGYLNSKDFGVAQNRKRIFIIGFKEPINFRLPIPVNSTVKLKDILESEVQEKYYLSEKAIKGLLSHTEKQKEKGNNFGANFLAGDNISNTIKSRYYKDGSDCLIKETSKNSQGMRINKADNVTDTLSALGGGQGAKTGLYAIPVLTPDREEKRQNGRRFKNDNEPMFTLTSQDKHGVFDGYRIRRLTPRECARLQGFPESYNIVCSDSQAYKQFGNSVTVNVIQAIAKNILECLTFVNDTNKQTKIC